MWKYTVYAGMMKWCMFSFYLSTIKKNATEEKEKEREKKLIFCVSY